MMIAVTVVLAVGTRVVRDVEDPPEWKSCSCEEGALQCSCDDGYFCSDQLDGLCMPNARCGEGCSRACRSHRTCPEACNVEVDRSPLLAPPDLPLWAPLEANHCLSKEQAAAAQRLVVLGAESEELKAEREELKGEVEQLKGANEILKAAQKVGQEKLMAGAALNDKLAAFNGELNDEVKKLKGEIKAKEAADRYQLGKMQGMLDECNAATRRCQLEQHEWYTEWNTRVSQLAATDPYDVLQRGGQAQFDALLQPFVSMPAEVEAALPQLRALRVYAKALADARHRQDVRPILLDPVIQTAQGLAKGGTIADKKPDFGEMRAQDWAAKLPGQMQMIGRMVGMSRRW